MSIFEDKIKRNRDYFDQRVPDSDHIERFIDKLDRESFSKNSKFHINLVYKVAASLALLIVAGFLLFYIIDQNQNTDKILVNTIEISQDLNDVYAYYDAVSINKVNEIDSFVDDTDQAEELKQTAMQRLEDIDGSIASIEKELSKNPDNENIKATLINIKRKKVKVMDDILTQLDFANTSLF